MTNDSATTERGIASAVLARSHARADAISTTPSTWQAYTAPAAYQLGFLEEAHIKEWDTRGVFKVRDLALTPISSGGQYSAVVHECASCPWISRGSGSGGVLFISYKAADVGYDQGLGASYKDKVFVRLLRQHSSSRAGS